MTFLGRLSVAVPSLLLALSTGCRLSSDDAPKAVPVESAPGESDPSLAPMLEGHRRPRPRPIAQQQQQQQQQQGLPPPVPTRSAPPPSSSGAAIVPNATVIDFGRVVYRGPVDLGPTLARIRRGERAPYRDDGTVFSNREHRLPSRPPGYYKEYVVPTAGSSGPGPQRVVLGDGGDVFYTGDHYQTFTRVR